MAVRGQECQAVFIRHIAVPSPVQLPCLVMEIITYRLSYMAASGMDHHTEVSLVVLLKLYEVVSAA